MGKTRCKGWYTGRKPKVYPKQKRILQRWRSKEITAVAAMKALGVSKTTFYRILQKEGIQVSMDWHQTELEANCGANFPYGIASCF